MDKIRRVFPAVPGQDGLATLRQLREAGWTDSAVRHARRTVWQQPYPGVFAAHRGPLAVQTKMLAAGLWAGREAVLTGLLALREVGLTTPEPQLAHFVVPERARARMSDDARTVRSARPLSVAAGRGCLKVASAARALVDAAALDRPGHADLEALAIATLQRGLTSVDELSRECWTRPRRLTSGVFTGLDAFTQGAWSRPERVLREVVNGAGGMPELRVNCPLETLEGHLIGFLDGYLEAAGVGIQVHSRAYHQGEGGDEGDTKGAAKGGRWAATVEHDSDFTAAGVRMVGVTPWTLYRCPERFLTRLRPVVRIGLESPPPQVRVRLPA